MKKKVGEYIMEELLGSGAYGEVYKGTSMKMPGEYFAIKMVSKKNMSEKVFHYLEREVEILQMMNHQNVVKLKDIKATDNHYYLVFEYCNGGDLSNFRKRQKGGAVPEDKIKFILKQIVAGLNELYSKKAIHRDIKLSNILLVYPDENSKQNEMPVVKIGDFGFARLITQVDGSEKSISDANEVMSFVGTPLNMAPELFHKEAYSFKADIWSLGTIIYELACGRNCYTGINKEDLIRNIDRAVYRIPKSLDLTTECIDLINACLQFNPSTRINWKGIVNHDFVASEKCTPFNPDDFKKVNKIPAGNFDDGDNYIFCSKVRYNFFVLPKKEPKPKQKEAKLETKKTEEIENAESKEETKKLEGSADADEEGFIKVEKPKELCKEEIGDFTIVSMDKLNIEDDHFN